MASFIGQSGHYLFFVEDDKGVIVDSRVSVVVASGSPDSLDTSRAWEAGEYTAQDESAADLALSMMNKPAAKAPNRGYTIPLGVQNAAKKGLREFSQKRKGTTPADVAIATTLVAGGQIDFGQVEYIANYFESRPLTAAGDTSWLLNGGNAGKKWAGTIATNNPGTTTEAAPDVSLLDTILSEDPTASPEFIARVLTNGDGIDRLYRVDLDGKSYVWNGGQWTDLGLGADGDIWKYDQALDSPELYDEVEKIHVVIDPASAIEIASLLAQNPYQNIYIEDLNPVEARLAMDALPDIDWIPVADTLTAAGAVGDGIYSSDERSANAEKQVRDGRGQFAKVGGSVMVNDDPSVTGKITQVNPQNGTVQVALNSGGSIIVPGKNVQGMSPTAITLPGQPVDIQPVDLSGILAEPRTPINRTQGTIPGTLPSMDSQSLHNVINNFPAWVKAERDSYQALGGSRTIAVQGKNSLNTGAEGQKIKAEIGHDITTNAYSNPLLNAWLNKKDSKGYQSNKIWYDPITAAITADTVSPVDDNGPTAPASTNGPTPPMTPDNSDVKPIYLAIVAPDDPQAVLQLIALVPASATSNQPMTFTRKNGEWVQDPNALAILNSATPPPVVPLDDESYPDVLQQVDTSQGAQDSSDQDQMIDETTAPDAEGNTAPSSPPDPSSDTPQTDEDAIAQKQQQDQTISAGPQPTTASLSPYSEFALKVLWGTQPDFIRAITAAGGADRSRGGAEKLRRYWMEGAGAAKIMWNTPGDWTRCVQHLGKYLGVRAKGYCSLRHHEATGMWPGDKANRQGFSANSAGVTYSDAFIRPTEAVLASAVTRVRGNLARNRVQGITLAPELTHIYNTSNRKGLTAAANAVSAVQPMGGAFFIPLALPEGIPSGDGRLIEKYAASIRDLPISLLWQINTDEGHKGAVVVGRIERLGRTPLGIGAGYGHFDTGVYGAEAERMVRAGFLRFVSADMDMFEADEEDAADGPQKTVQQKRLTIDQARVMAVTIVAKPAFQEATIRMVPDAPTQEETVIPDGIYVDGTDPYEEAALVAAGYVASSIPLAPPASWFDNPKLDRPTPLTIDDSGHVFGHIAAWDMDHIGMSFGTKPPKSKSNYAYFHSGLIRTDEGDDIPVGQLTLAGGHAGMEASARDAIKHYDDTASAFADVHAGEDKFGIWVAGSLRPGVTPEQVRAARASAPSGDWRPIRGRLELVAVCQVNVPGFPIARTMVASGQVLSLVAAGALPLAKMKGDPVAELNERLRVLESVSNKETALRASAVRQRMQGAIDRRNAELAARADGLRGRFEEFGFIPASVRKKAADKGEALPDGSFPIRNKDDLSNAIQAFGRAKNKPAVKAHIKKRAKALGLQSMIPENWSTASADAITASVETLRERAEAARAKVEGQDFSGRAGSNAEGVATFATRAVPATAPANGNDDNAADVHAQEVDSAQKFIPGKNQPRNSDGQFRDVLARLKSNLGDQGNTDVLNKLKETQQYEGRGNYPAALKSAMDLKNMLNRIDDGALDAHSIDNVRETARALAKVLSNLPLPFDNQAQKIRFSDLPPVLRDLVNDFVARTQKELGKDKAAAPTAGLLAFKSGHQMMSQSEISSQMSKLLRLLN